MKNSEEAAFPILDPNSSYWTAGLSKREYFAALAMQATDLEKYADNFGNEWASKVAHDSILLADELLKQLEK